MSLCCPVLIISLWAAQCTQPDISFSVNQLSQFLQDPSDAHWKTAMCVLYYLISTKQLGLKLGGGPYKICQKNSLVPNQRKFWHFLWFGTGGAAELGELQGDAAHPGAG